MKLFANLHRNVVQAWSAQHGNRSYEQRHLLLHVLQLSCFLIFVALTGLRATIARSETPASPAVSIDTAVTRENSPPITLDDCVRRALKYGLDLRLQRRALSIVQNGVPIARSQFYPVVTGSTHKSVSHSTDDDSLPTLRNDTISVGVGVSQLLPFGAVIGLEANQNNFRSDSERAGVDAAYTSDFTLTVRQPLSKGLGPNVTTLPLQRALKDLDIAEHDYADQALAVIEKTEQAYYVLSSARDELGVLQTSLDLSNSLREEAESRRSVGMATRMDVLQAEVDVAKRRLGVLEAENLVRSREDTLLSIVDPFEFDRPLGSTVIDDFTGAFPTVESSYKQALETQPALLAARAALEAAELDRMLAEDQLKPAIDLELALGFDGRQRTYSSAWGQTFEKDRSSWTAGLVITYPLWRIAEKARLDQSRMLIGRQELLLSQLEQDTLVQLRSAVRDINTSRESVTIAGKATQLSEQQYEAERERFTAGLSTSRRVFEAQTDLEIARVAELRARLRLRTALSALRRIDGSAFLHYGLALTLSN